MPVLLFHADFEFFSGGFLGVDVFFVISGFLLTKIIYGETLQAKFSFTTFYKRRIKRILPAFFLVGFVTGLIGFFILLPNDLLSLWKSFAAAALFASNVFFWREAGDGYFRPFAGA